jgi:hypothetical protein
MELPPEDIQISDMSMRVCSATAHILPPPPSLSVSLSLVVSYSLDFVLEITSPSWETEVKAPVQPAVPVPTSGQMRIHISVSQYENNCVGRSHLKGKNILP